jgi:hypothetical protein
MTRKSTPEDFWARVVGNRSQRNGCWNWSGAKNSTGYGTVMYQGKPTTAHRLAAFLTGLVETTDAPRDKRSTGFILHNCDNRLCCNPSHMKVGTYAENQLDAYARRRRKAYRGETHSNAKQTRESVSLIRDMSVHGISQEDIAALLCVSQSSISKILRKESYVSTL